MAARLRSARPRPRPRHPARPRRPFGAVSAPPWRARPHARRGLAVLGRRAWRARLPLPGGCGFPRPGALGPLPRARGFPRPGALDPCPSVLGPRPGEALASRLLPPAWPSPPARSVPRLGSPLSGARGPARLGAVGHGARPRLGPSSSLRGAPARPPARPWPSAPPRRGPLPLSWRDVAPLRSTAPARRGFGSRGCGAPMWRGPLPVARPWRARALLVRTVLWRGSPCPRRDA
jgi:hypothetical protein